MSYLLYTLRIGKILDPLNGAKLHTPHFKYVHNVNNEVFDFNVKTSQYDQFILTRAHGNNFFYTSACVLLTKMHCHRLLNTLPYYVTKPLPVGTQDNVISGSCIGQLLPIFTS